MHPRYQADFQALQYAAQVRVSLDRWAHGLATTQGLRLEFIQRSDARGATRPRRPPIVWTNARLALA